MDKGSLENIEYLIISILTLAALPPLVHFFKWFLAKKNSELEGKESRETSALKLENHETKMKLWVTEQINILFEKVKSIFKDDLKELENRLMKELTNSTNNFSNAAENMRVLLHKKDDIIAQQSGTITLCKEAIHEANKLMEAIKKHA